MNKAKWDEVLQSGGKFKDDVTLTLSGRVFNYALTKAKKEERSRIMKYIHNQFRNGKFMLVDKERFKGKTTTKDLDKWWGFNTNNTDNKKEND